MLGICQYELISSKSLKEINKKFDFFFQINFYLFIIFYSFKFICKGRNQNLRRQGIATEIELVLDFHFLRIQRDLRRNFDFVLAPELATGFRQIHHLNKKNLIKFNYMNIFKIYRRNVVDDIRHTFNFKNLLK